MDQEREDKLDLPADIKEMTADLMKEDESGLKSNHLPAELESIEAEPEQGNCLLEIEYALTEKELESAFEAVGIYRLRGKGQWIRSGLLVAVIAITVYNIVIDRSYLVMGSILTGFCVLLLALIWIIPKMGLKKRVQQAYNPDPVTVRFYNGKIVSKRKGNEKYGEIRLGNKNKVEQHGRLYIVKMENNRLFAIPERAIDASKLELARSVLFGWDLNEYL